jgi:hypothetical protein
MWEYSFRFAKRALQSPSLHAQKPFNDLHFIAGECWLLARRCMHDDFEGFLCLAGTCLRRLKFALKKKTSEKNQQCT